MKETKTDGNFLYSCVCCKNIFENWSWKCLWIDLTDCLLMSRGEV